MVKIKKKKTMHDSLAEVLPQPLLQDKTKISSRVSGPGRSASEGVWGWKEEELRFLVSMISLLRKEYKGSRNGLEKKLEQLMHTATIR